MRKLGQTTKIAFCCCKCLPCCLGCLLCLHCWPRIDGQNHKWIPFNKHLPLTPLVCIWFWEKFYLPVISGSCCRSDRYLILPLHIIKILTPSSTFLKNTSPDILVAVQKTERVGHTMHCRYNSWAHAHVISTNRDWLMECGVNVSLT